MKSLLAILTLSCTLALATVDLGNSPDLLKAVAGDPALLPAWRVLHDAGEATLRKDITELKNAASHLDEIESAGGYGKWKVGRGRVRTIPSRIPDINAKPRGPKTTISKAADAATMRSLIRENESAETLAKHGYDIEQNLVLNGIKRKPDYLIENTIFDCYSPSTDNVRNIASAIAKKVEVEQARRIILNLDDATVTLEDIKRQISQYPIQGLEEIIIIKENQVIPFYPF